MTHFVTNWYWLTVAMTICFVTCILLIAIQRSAFRWYSKLKNDQSIFKKKGEHLCLYGAYIASSICSASCLLNHISNYFPEWYCYYGMSVCVIFHETAKTFGYGFFLERAKATILSTKSEILPEVMTKYILPLYITSYCVLYCILCPLTFRGLSVNPNSLTSIPTACLFDQYQSWIFYLSVGVEVCNSIFFVFVFVHPLYKIINSEQYEIIKIIKYNIIFSSVACISSVTFLFYRAFAGNTTLSHYLWLAGNVDLVINALCIFIMVTVNRKYLYSAYQKHLKCIKCLGVADDKSVVENDVSVESTNTDRIENKLGNSRHFSIELHDFEGASLIEMNSMRSRVNIDLRSERIRSEPANNQTMTFSANLQNPEDELLNESTTGMPRPLPKLADLRSATTYDMSNTFPNLSSMF